MSKLTIFNNSLNEEYTSLVNHLSFSYQEIAHLVSNGFEVADLSEATKKSFLSQIKEEISKMNRADG